MPDITDLIFSGGQAMVSWIGGKLRTNPPAIPPPPPMLEPPKFQPPGYLSGNWAPMPTIAVPAALAPVAVPAPIAPPALPAAASPPMPVRLPAGASGPAADSTSYSSQIAQGIACAACTKDHLATMAGAAQALEAAQAAGDSQEVRYQLARIAAESQALQRYDWSPEKIAATPADRLVAVRAVQPLVESLTERLPTPPEIALAWGAADESIRFTRGTLTDQDRQEIAIRLQDVDERTNYLERVEFSPEKSYGQLPPDQAEPLLTHLRNARHAVAQDPYNGRNLQHASQGLATVATALTPLPTDAEIAAICGQIRAAQATFYRAYFDA